MRWLPVLWVAIPIAAQQICPPTPLYTPCDLTFDLTAEEAKDAQIHAEVKSPKFRTALVPAFSESPGKWVVRFSPIDAGQYDFRLTSNIPRFNGKTGTVEATASDHPGFIRPANVHHWRYTDSKKPHLWTGAECLDCFSIPRPKFDEIIAGQAAVNVNHLRVKLGPLQQAPETEARLRAMNEKGIAADLILFDTPVELIKTLPTWQEREQHITLVVSRFAAFNITWLIFREWEPGADGRPLAKEIGSLIKKLDPNDHPRSTGARATSAALLADGWMDYVTIGTADDALPAVEHQFYARPFVSAAAITGSDTEKRYRFWNLIMDGQYPAMSGAPPELIKIWNELFTRTRYWELEPWFEVDGGRAVALDDVEYLVYIQKPAGPVEVTTIRHGYEVYWIDPATGAVTAAKGFRGEKFVGEPPDKSHDWLLHISRDGRKEGMAKSYRFESRENLMQEIEQDPAKVPYQISSPTEDKLSTSKPARFSLEIRRQTRATREMMFVWTAEVVASGQGYRVLCLSTGCTITPPPNLVTKFPGVLNLRVSAINANGKAYALDRVYQLVP